MAHIQPQSKGRIRQQNQSLIFDAAQAEFVKFGFKGASVKRIAERAGLPRANIHYYYKNKAELYTAVLNDIVQTWNSSFDTIKAEDACGRDRGSSLCWRRCSGLSCRSRCLSWWRSREAGGAP